MSRGRVLVTPRSGTKPLHSSLAKIESAGFELLVPTPGQMPDERQLQALAPQIVGYVAGVEQVNREFLNSARQLKVISRNGTGIDNIDLQEAHRLGIRVVKAEGANAQGVTELAIAQLFLMARNTFVSVGSLRSGEWDRRLGVELSGKTLGVVGCGQIGKRVASAAIGIGMNVLAFDAFPDETFQPSDMFSFSSLEALLQFSDFITLHCPPQETPLIDDSAFDFMKDGVFLVNTARASLVDLAAADRALRSGKLRAFACDVFEPEPPGMLPIMAHSNFFGTAHIGGYTQESVDRAMSVAVQNLLEALEA